MNNDEKFHRALVAFPDSYKDQFGVELTANQLSSYLESLLLQKQIQSIRQVFDTFKPYELKEVLGLLSRKLVNGIKYEQELVDNSYHLEKADDDIIMTNKKANKKSKVKNG